MTCGNHFVLSVNQILPSVYLQTNLYINPIITQTTRYEKMEYIHCGKSGLKLPRLALGLWHNFGSSDSLENQKALICGAFDRGITHFDLANNYGPIPGAAEENFGRILKSELPAYRDEMIISTKAGYGMWKGPYGDWGSRKYF